VLTDDQLVGRDDGPPEEQKQESPFVEESVHFL